MLDLMIDLHEAPIRSRKVRAGVTAYQYRNGTINIAGQKYCLYSMSEAIKRFRAKYPANRKN